MKPIREQRQVETFGLDEDRGFQIRATAKAFEILSSGLYKDKITAVLREISANARDAHVDAGIPDRPFTVHLPSPIEPYLSIRDYGKGLTHELMLKLYQTYFGSLKEETNDLIGGLGLGSKSPFSYTDAYTAVSRTDMRRTYDLFKDENGEPRIALRQEEALDEGEETGLEVIVPLTNNHDSREFLSKARTVFEHYPVLPEFTGSKFEGVISYETILEGKGWRITNRSTSSYNSNARAIMGVIAYPIDLESSISTEDANADPALEQARRILNCPIDIEFGIGTLDITAGREDLSYVKQTKATIKSRLIEVSKEIADRVSEQFKDCKSLYEAKKLYGTLFGYHSTLARALGDKFKVTWRGVEIDNTMFTINMEDFPNTKLVLYKDSKRGGHKFTKDFRAPDPKTKGMGYRDEREYKLTLDAQEKVQTLIYIDDLDGQGQHSARIFNLRLNSTSRPHVILVQTSDKAELARLKKLLDGITFAKVSDLDRPVYERAVFKAKAKVLSTSGKTRTSINGPKDGPWNEVDVDVEKGGLFVLTSRGRIMRGTAEDQDSLFSQTYIMARELGLIQSNEEVYAIPLSMAKQFTETKKNQSKWKNFFDVIVERGKKGLTPAVQQRIIEGQSRGDFSVPIGRGDFVKYLRQLSEGFSDKHPIKKFLALYEEESKRSAGDWQYWASMAQFCGVKPTGKTVNLNKEWEAIVATYPLIRFTIASYDCFESLPELHRYVSLVDGATKKRKREEKKAAAAVVDTTDDAAPVLAVAA